MSYVAINYDKLQAAREKHAHDPMMVEVMLAYWDYHSTTESVECLRFAQNRLDKYPHHDGVKVELRRHEELLGLKVSELICIFPESCDKARAAAQGLEQELWKEKSKYGFK
jgi:hypothetical protein